MSRIPRRAVLRGIAGGAAATVALPLLEAMLDDNGTALADGSSLPKRFGVFFWGNGYAWSSRGRPDLWTPRGTSSTAWELSEQLAPLAPVRAHMSVVTGLEPKTDIPGDPGGQGDGHMRGIAVALTADRPRSEGFSHDAHVFAFNRATIDQVIARDERFYGSDGSRFRSLELGVGLNRFHGYGSWNCISHNGPDSLNLPIVTVEQLFHHLFDVPADLTILSDRASLLDAVAGDARRLRARLGARDRARLEAHLEHIGDIQRRLRRTGGVCRAPATPTRAGGFDGTPGNEPLYEKLGAMMDLLVVALQCDLTRVFSFMFTGAGSQTTFPAAGVGGGLHSLCHAGDWDAVRRSTLYTMGCLRMFVEKLAAADDVGGVSKLVDNVLVYATSEFSEGEMHGVGEFPVLLAGHAGGAVRAGIHYREPGGNITKVHTTILRALGLDVASYGFNGGETTDHLTEILI